MGEEFNVPTNKTIFEIKIHYLAYKMHVSPDSSKETDVCEREVGGFQSIIDCLYEARMR